MRIIACQGRALAATIVASIVASQTASAADLPARPVTKAPAAVVAASWTGFYVNGGGGYGLWTAETHTSEATPPLDALPLVQRGGGKGWLGRVGAGFDYQFNQNIVVGMFADFDLSDLKGTISDPRVSLSAEIKQKWSWAVGGRAGWLINPSLLSYVNGGYINTRFSSGIMQPFSTSVFSGYTTPAFSRGGWFLGGGAETALGGGWFGRTEYRYAYYGDQVLSDTSPTPPAAFFSSIQNIHFKPTVQTVTTQLVYKLSSGASTPSSIARSTAGPTNWNGGYVNAGLGYGMWAADESTTALPGSANVPVVVAQRLGGNGWLARAGGGYDYRFAQRILAGVFADVDIASLKGSIQDAAAGLEGKTKQNWSWAVGARAGWLVSQNTLTYVNAGYTMAHFTSATMNSMLTAAPFFGLSTEAFTTDGWFVGGGVEAALGSGWFWRNEYRSAHFGSQSVTNTSADPAALIRNNIDFKPTIQTVTTQLLYKFGSH